MEMTSGVILGPSVLGRLLPEYASLLFPGGIALASTAPSPAALGSSSAHLYVLANIGLTFYMFMVGGGLSPDRFSKAALQLSQFQLRE
jgi:Kef-type K+ transport system membrane component KefB